MNCKGLSLCQLGKKLHVSFSEKSCEIPKQRRLTEGICHGCHGCNLMQTVSRMQSENSTKKPTASHT